MTLVSRHWISLKESVARSNFPPAVSRNMANLLPRDGHLQGPLPVQILPAEHSIAYAILGPTWYEGTLFLHATPAASEHLLSVKYHPKLSTHSGRLEIGPLRDSVDLLRFHLLLYYYAVLKVTPELTSFTLWSLIMFVLTGSWTYILLYLGSPCLIRLMESVDWYCSTYTGIGRQKEV